MASDSSEMDGANPETKSSEAPPVVCPSDDALVDILSRVPAKSRFRFKCVSKPWRDLITDRLRCRKFPQTLEGFFFGGGGGKNFGHFVDPSGRPSPLVDASFSFLTELPEIEKIHLLGSCNGLLLFGHRRVSDSYDSLGYVVCNPATQQWVAVPSSGWTPSLEEDPDLYEEPEATCTYLIFDPAASPHFQLVQFTQDGVGVLVQFRRNNDDYETEVRTYSSESGVWSKRATEWGAHGRIISHLGSAFVDGMLHFMVDNDLVFERDDRIVAVDREGKRCRNIRWVEERGYIWFVGQSQGRLHCISGLINNSSVEMSELSVWVLEDYDREEWVLKHSVSFAHLFGDLSGEDAVNFYLVSIHPDGNMLFFVRGESQELVSYHMDSKELCVLCTIGRGDEYVTQYVPYFSESPALAKKH